jgi:hypothetical protein
VKQTINHVAVFELKSAKGRRKNNNVCVNELLEKRACDPKLSISVNTK